MLARAHLRGSVDACALSILGACTVLTACDLPHEAHSNTRDVPVAPADATAMDTVESTRDVAFAEDHVAVDDTVVTETPDVVPIEDAAVDVSMIDDVADAGVTDDVPVIEAGSDAGFVFTVQRADHMDTVYVGGSGGEAFSSDCDDGEVAVGVLGNAGFLYVNAVGLTCGVLNPDGSIGATHALSAVGGGSGFDFDDHCPVGEVLVEFAGKAGGLVDHLRGDCAPVAGWLMRDTMGATLGEHGGSGGSAYTLRCPSGYVLYGVDGTTTNYALATRLQSVRLHCERVLY